MTCWLRFEADGAARFGTLTGDTITEFDGTMFGEHRESGRRFALAAVRLLTPTQPGKMIGLWNNFRERAKVENQQAPAYPFYFLKPSTSFAAHGEPILRPPGYTGRVVFEGELGIVIGRRCKQVPLSGAKDVIFGYTCVNDVTARDLLRADPTFPQWARAKGLDTFGVFGPYVVTGLDEMQLRVRSIVSGVERQNYPVADMFFPPDEIVSRISQDMTLEPGDIIACGTSLGAEEMREGESIAIAIDGIGVLENRFFD